MQILRALLLLASFTAQVLAQGRGDDKKHSKVLYFTNVPNPITDGEQTVIQWATNDTETPVTLTLKQGRVIGSLREVYTVTTAGTGNEYVWLPPTWLPNNENYELEIA